MRYNGRFRQVLRSEKTFVLPSEVHSHGAPLPHFHHRRLSGGGLIRVTILRLRFIGHIIAQKRYLVNRLLQFCENELANIQQKTPRHGGRGVRDLI